MSKHRRTIERIKGMSWKARLGYGATAVAAVGIFGSGVALAATANSTVAHPSISVSGVSSTSVTFNAERGEDVQIYTVGTNHQVYRNDVSAGFHTATGLQPGTAYDIRATLGNGWTTPELVITTGATGTGGSGGATGPQGPAGPQGPKGDTGPQGAPGESLVSQTALAPATVKTGGSFASLKTDLGKVTVPNGTYEVIVSAKIASDAKSDATEFPSLYVYDGAPKADFSNDLFNFGEGALSPTTSLDQYVNGEQVVKVTSGEIDIEGFGYSTDRGQGEFNFEGGTVTVLSVATS